MTLGEQLKAIERKKEGKNYLEDEESSYRWRKAARFWDAVRDEISTAIRAGKEPKPIRLDYFLFGNANPYAPKLDLEFPKLAEEFKDWCAKHGLNCEISWTHDGVGIDSWHEIRVKAA